MIGRNCCPECGARLPEDAPAGLCPKCLMMVAMGGEDAKATLDQPARIDGPGTTVGRYQLLELIGEGGMGLVYLAEQKEPVKRRVAFKIIKPGMDSRQVIARFEAERQTLAVLDHPNIAHIFDAGCTETGRPYFVMEYVKGMSITRYCDENKLTIEQRLRLFEQVCEAVHHAHQKGIIHRDLKPSNILVSVHGDRAVPKIIDFGIAKAITQPLTDKTFVTFQGQLLGTPEYMSPEQVDLATQDIDTRSDIYSLGVVLYELLAGVLPFESESFAKAGLAEIQQTIREQEPDSPSIRLTNLGEKAKTIAASRSTQVVPLARRLHHELEWIPLKAMRKDRCRRYRSASEMADDVHNYLTGRPLLAGPETTIYRVRKFVRKHAGSVATVALVAVAVVLGLVVSTAMYFRAEDARKNEAVARGKAEQAEATTKRKAEELRRTLYVNSIQLADVKYREGNIRSMRELLTACPNDLRGWEWHRLDHVSDLSERTVRIHNEAVTSLSLSPDGDHVASASNDGTVKVLNAATGEALTTLRGHDGRVYRVAYSPDGTRIASAGEDRTIRIWDAINGTELVKLIGHKGEVYDVSFSPDGSLIASGGAGGEIRIWDAKNGREVTTLAGHPELVDSVVFSPDAKRLVSCGGLGDENACKVWDVSSGTEVLTFPASTETVSLSPSGKQIASGGRYNTIRLWDATTGQELKTLYGHIAGVISLAYSRDGKFLVSGAEDNTVRVWDPERGSELHILPGHEDRILSVAINSDGTRVFSGSFDNTIKIWDTVSQPDQTVFTDHQQPLCVAFSPDGKRIASGNRYGTVKIWDVTSGAELVALRGHDEEVVSLAFSTDGTRLVSGSLDKAIRLWDVSGGKELIGIRGHKDDVWAVSFIPILNEISVSRCDDLEVLGQ